MLFVHYILFSYIANEYIREQTTRHLYTHLGIQVSNFIRKYATIKDFARKLIKLNQTSSRRYSQQKQQIDQC